MLPWRVVFKLHLVERSIVLALILGCEGLSRSGEEIARTAIVVDSAGVEIVTIRYEDAARETALTIQGPPVVSLAGDDPSPLLLGVSSAVVVDGGVVAFGDAFDRKVVLIDDRGNVTRMIGHRGTGPGEFESIDGLAWSPDRGLHVWDARLGRVTRIDADRGITEARSSGIAGLREIIFAGVTADAAVIFATHPMVRELLGATDGVRQDSVQIYIHSHGTAPNQVAICRIVGEKRFLLSADGITSTLRLPLASPTTVTATGTGFAYVAEDGSAVTVSMKDCQPNRIIRIMHRPKQIDANGVDRYRDSVRVDADKMIARGPPVDAIGKWLRRAADHAPAAEYYPIVADLRTDSDGNLWIEIARQYHGGDDHEWLIIGRQSRVTRLVGPSLEEIVLAVSPELVVTKRVGEFGAEHVHVGAVRHPKSGT
jgi:hypothetical protein